MTLTPYFIGALDSLKMTYCIYKVGKNYATKKLS